MTKIKGAFENTLEQIAERLGSIRKTKVDVVRNYRNCTHCSDSRRIPWHDYAFVEQAPGGGNFLFGVPRIKDNQYHSIDDSEIDEKHLVMEGSICDPFELSLSVEDILDKFTSEYYVTTSFYRKGACGHFSVGGRYREHPDSNEAKSNKEFNKLLEEVRAIANRNK
ncbi:MAG: hypothetical protein V1734_05185 [Nanoarchaeota archaeon]